MRSKKPPGPLPSASPSMEIMMLSARQWKVWGALRLVLALISSGSMTLWSFGDRASSVSTIYSNRQGG